MSQTDLLYLCNNSHALLIFTYLLKIIYICLLFLLSRLFLLLFIVTVLYSGKTICFRINKVVRIRKGCQFMEEAWLQ